MRQQQYLEDAIEQLRQNPTDLCVVWPFTRNKNHYGYGQIIYNHGQMLVHRIAYQLYYGKEPSQMVLHKCGNHDCYNPQHLYEGNAKQNSQDMIDHWGYGPGGRRKLTEQDVIEIIELLKQEMKHWEIAARFGVARATITQINTGRTWQHIPRNGKPPARVHRRSRQAIVLQFERQKPTKHLRLTNEQVETVRGLLLRGFKIREVADWFDLKSSQLLRILDRAA